MSHLVSQYLPADRRAALTSGAGLPVSARGSALFADISGFTAVTERLRETLGARRGAEALVVHLNRVYDALIAEVERYDGSIIGFAGDAITCWFGGDASATRAATCGAALLDAMHGVEQVTLPKGETANISLKVVVATGLTQRFVVGDPSIQRIDTLAGATVARLASGEHVAQRGELLLDAPTATLLGNSITVRAWRESDGARFAVVGAFTHTLPRHQTAPARDQAHPDEHALLAWVLPAFANQIKAGFGEFAIELRPAAALFLRFVGVDYDHDASAADELDRLVRLAQAIVSRYDGSILQLTIGDKGSYMYAAFGAPHAHEDDVARTLNAALELRNAIGDLGSFEAVQIGIGRGVMRTGAYGSDIRRTYGVLGDEVNLAARLMSLAAPGEILVSEAVAQADVSAFTLERLEPIRVKGKAKLVAVFRLTGRRERSFAERFYSTPFIGRDVELAALGRYLQPIVEGRHAGIITISGEPGIGKSRLAFEAQKRLQAEQPVAWFTGQADALNPAPLGIFAYFLRPYFGQQRDREHAANLAAFDTVFEDVLRRAGENARTELVFLRSFLAGLVDLIIPDSPYQRQDEKTRIATTIAAIKAWARAISVRQPLVLHFEDAQWFDSSSLRAIQQLAHTMESAPLALLLTSRSNDDGTSFSLPNIYAVPVHAVDLTRLSNAAVGALAAGVVGGAVAERLVRFVQERTAGSPFFTEQLLFDLQERGALIESEGFWDILLGVSFDVPLRVNEVLIARLDRLAAQVKAVVQTAAVLGREFAVDVLSQMLRADVAEAVREAERGAIWSALDVLRYLFRHALLRDAAYEMQAHERLRALHRLAAEAIEQLYPNDTNQYETLLEHWHAAGELDRELYYVAPVCSRLIEVVAEYDRAQRLLERALAQLPTQDARRAPLLNRLSLAHIRRGNHLEARETALQAHSLSADDRRVVATSLRRLAMVASAQGSLASARSYFDQSLVISRALGDRSAIAATLNLIGDVLEEQGLYVEARTHLEQSLAIRRELHDDVGVGGCLLSLGSVLRQQGAYADARTHLEQSLAHAREIGERTVLAGSMRELGIIARLQGNYGEALAYNEQALAIVREVGNRQSIARSLISLGNISLAQAAYGAARSYYEQSLAIVRAVGHPLMLAGCLNNLGEVAVLEEDYAAAEAYHHESLAIRRAANERGGVGESLANLGTLAFRRGDYRAAETYHRESLALHREFQAGSVYSNLGWLGRTLLRLGDTAEARRLLREAFQPLGADDVAHKLALLVLGAELYWKQERLEDAAELASLIVSHAAASAEVRSDAQALLAELRHGLGVATFAAALERGTVLDLDDAAARMLAEEEHDYE